MGKELKGGGDYKKMDSRLLGNDIEKELKLPHPGKAGLAMTERGMDSCFRRNDIEECGNDREER